MLSTFQKMFTKISMCKLEQQLSHTAITLWFKGYSKSIDSELLSDAIKSPIYLHKTLKWYNICLRPQYLKLWTPLSFEKVYIFNYNPSFYKNSRALTYKVKVSFLVFLRLTSAGMPSLFTCLPKEKRHIRFSMER